MKTERKIKKKTKAGTVRDLEIINYLIIEAWTTKEKTRASVNYRFDLKQRNKNKHLWNKTSAKDEDLTVPKPYITLKMKRKTTKNQNQAKSSKIRKEN